MIAFTSWTNKVGQKTLGGLTFGCHLDVFFNREIVKELKRLPGTTETQSSSFVHRHAVDFSSFEINATSGWNETGDAVNECRFARSVWPDEPDELAFFDGDIDVIDSPQTTKCHRHARCC